MVSQKKKKKKPLSEQLGPFITLDLKILHNKRDQEVGEHYANGFSAKKSS